MYYIYKFWVDHRHTEVFIACPVSRVWHVCLIPWVYRTECFTECIVPSDSQLEDHKVKIKQNIDIGLRRHDNVKIHKIEDHISWQCVSWRWRRLQNSAWILQLLLVLLLDSFYFNTFKIILKEPKLNEWQDLEFHEMIRPEEGYDS